MAFGPKIRKNKERNYMLMMQCEHQNFIMLLCSPTGLSRTFTESPAQRYASAKGPCATGANIENRRVECEVFERNKIGKILRKIEVIDLIEIEVVMSNVFGIAVPGCEL